METMNTMKKTNKFLDSLAKNVIDNLSLDGDNKFSSRKFIWGFMDKYEDEYIEMLDEVRRGKHGNGVFHKLHTHIGLYLERNADRLGITKVEGEREPSESPFDNPSTTQVWIRL